MIGALRFYDAMDFVKWWFTIAFYSILWLVVVGIIFLFFVTGFVPFGIMNGFCWFGIGFCWFFWTRGSNKIIDGSQNFEQKMKTKNWNCILVVCFKCIWGFRFLIVFKCELLFFWGGFSIVFGFLFIWRWVLICFWMAQNNTGIYKNLQLLEKPIKNQLKWCFGSVF